jgi:hypothetical protein
LVTDRYLDEDNDFYEMASKYFTWTITINEKLRDYIHNKDAVTVWFMGKENVIERDFKTYFAKVMRAKKKLQNSI